MLNNSAKKTFLVLLAVYAAIRLFSYIFPPATPLLAQHSVNSILSLIIAGLAAYSLIRGSTLGWYLVAGEIILAGSGNFLSVEGISLRTILLIVALAIYFIKKLKSKDFGFLSNNRLLTAVLFIVLATALFSAGRGYYLGNNIKLIIADIIPYFFLLYAFPLKELWSNKKFKTTAGWMLAAAIAGNTLLALITVTGFSGHLFQLQDSYYHWLRDAANAKITDLNFNFYRLIFNEHLLLVPLLLYFLYKQMRKHSATYLSGILAMLFLMSVNFTRIYFLALAVGLLFLFQKNNWKKWLAHSLAALAMIFIFFTATHLAASRGQSLGWQMFGLRLQSITAPQTENSSLSRMLLLPKIIEKIKINPVLGNGLGDTVKVYSPIFEQEITTPHFDWGYLEIIDEMGIIGLAAWLALIAIVLFQLRLSSVKTKKRLVASLVALLIINITSPALFHVFGVIWIIFIIGASRYSKMPDDSALN